jgi:hypothetical protein
MKNFKMLGLLAIAAAALMAFAGTASATLTEAAGDPVEAGDSIHAEAPGGTKLDGSVVIECLESTVNGVVSTNGGTSGPISVLSFSKCGNDTVSVLNRGTLAIASSGAVTSTGAEITIQTHRVVLGFPVTTHCIYKTNNTAVGTLVSGTEAKLNIGSAGIPQIATDGACGNDAVWTGSYRVNSPHYLAVD